MNRQAHVVSLARSLGGMPSISAALPCSANLPSSVGFYERRRVRQLLRTDLASLARPSGV
jgi:hypothetical protein